MRGDYFHYSLNRSHFVPAIADNYIWLISGGGNFSVNAQIECCPRVKKSQILDPAVTNRIIAGENNVLRSVCVFTLYIGAVGFFAGWLCHDGQRNG
jgi:hypothetical protein